LWETNGGVGGLKENMYKNNPQTSEKQKQNIRQCISSLDKEQYHFHAQELFDQIAKDSDELKTS
jgi:hypothetical protein